MDSCVELRVLKTTVKQRTTISYSRWLCALRNNAGQSVLSRRDVKYCLNRWIIWTMAESQTDTLPAKSLFSHGTLCLAFLVTLFLFSWHSFRHAYQSSFFSTRHISHYPPAGPENPKWTELLCLYRCSAVNQSSIFVPCDVSEVRLCNFSSRKSSCSCHLWPQCS